MRSVASFFCAPPVIRGIYSDFGDNIAEMLGKTLVPTDKDIIAACYKMTLKTLKDKDGIYDIRKYFNV